MTLTLQELQELRDTRRNTEHYGALNDAVALVGFQRDLYGEDTESVILVANNLIIVKG